MNNKIKIENIMSFENDFITEIMDWATDSLFSKLWMEPEWMKCAKGGNAKEHYSDKNDMFYIIHIFSGTAMALRVLDYKYREEAPPNIEDLEYKVKRSVFGYLFHDYNKLGNYEANKFMNDRTILDVQLDKLSSVMEDLNLTKNDVYFIAFSTETGTQYRANSIDSYLEHDLQFESSFSRLADTLSSIFSESSEGMTDIYFDNAPCIPKSKIFEISMAGTTFITISSFLKKVIVDIISKNGGFYLWSSINSIFYVNDIEIKIDPVGIAKKIIERIGNEAHLENGISLNDRKIDISSSNIGSIGVESLYKFISMGPKFKQVLHLEDIKLKPEIKKHAEKYSDMTSNTLSFSINFHKDMPISKTKKERSVREYLDADDIDPNDVDIAKKIQERIHAFYIRYIQLQTSFKSDQARIVREELYKIVSDNETILKPLLPKNNQHKSAFLIPLFLTSTYSDSIDWNVMESDILSDINRGNHSQENEKILSDIIKFILNVDAIDLPEVPDKSGMSLITGYPAKSDAHGENLFGLGTNSFNNRLKTSGISNGKIDPYTTFEFSLRRVLAPKVSSKYSSAVLFLSFPGAIPYMNMNKFLELSSNSDSELRVNNIKLSMEDKNAKLDNFRFDSTYYIYLNDPKSDEDILRQLMQSIDLAIKSKLHVLLSFSNNIFYESWKETILVELGSSVLTGMKWDNIRCNNIFEIKNKIVFFLQVANQKNQWDFGTAATIIKEYLRDNFSISYYVHKQIIDNKIKLLLKKEKIDLYRKLVYGNRGEKMKKLEDLGDIASDLYRLKSRSSGSDRGWMIRESLEVLEKVKAESKTENISDLTDFVSGHLYKNLERFYTRENFKFKPDNVKIIDFTEILFSLINNEFKGKIPSGITRSYLIDAFEIEYILASDRKWKQE